MRKNTILLLAITVAIFINLSACKDRKTAETTPSPVNQPGAKIETQKITPSFELTDKDKQILLEIARKTLDSWIRDRKVPEFTVPEGILRKDGAAFVTLREHGELRGCIGHLVAREPLWMCVRDMAVSASTQDPRFPPVRPEELSIIDLEVSVLTPPEQIKSPAEIELGRHGVIVRKGFNSGVFLPQVATETGWDKDTFLAQLCAQKAGLPPDCYKDPEVTLLRFEAIVFAEPDKP